MENMIKFGPKYMSGSHWDEGGKTKILQIIISHENYDINSIQFVYVVDGKVLRSDIHGERNGLNLDVVTFDHPSEYLVSLSGQCSNNSGKLVSIAFGTNKLKYGPFGREDVNLDYSLCYSTFAYNFGQKDSFGGFHGSVYNSLVYGIGVYIKPIGTLGETGKVVRRVKSEDD